MRLDDLAIRLVAVEAKLANLTGTTVNTDSATSIEELDARLAIVEVQVEQLIAVRTQEHVDAIVAAVAVAIEHIEGAVAEVVALSPSVDHEEAADIVTDVVTAQLEAEAIEHTEVADIVSAAVQAVVAADPEVVVDPVAITEAIMEAVADMPTPAPEVAQQVADAVAEVIAAATGVEQVAPEVVQQVVEAVAIPSNSALDAIEARLEAAEAKVDTLLGK
jgi:hypothetical protein